MPKRPDLIARAAQADPHISEDAERAARADYAQSTSTNKAEREEALAQLRRLSAWAGQDGVQIVVAGGGTQPRTRRRRLTRKASS